MLSAIPWWVTLSLLVGFAGVLCYAIWTPPKQPDPQRGMAIGCLLFVLGLDIVLLLLFGIARWFRVGWLEQSVASICVFIDLFALLSFIENLVKAWKARRK